MAYQHCIELHKHVLGSCYGNRFAGWKPLTWSVWLSTVDRIQSWKNPTMIRVTFLHVHIRPLMHVQSGQNRRHSCVDPFHSLSCIVYIRDSFSSSVCTLDQTIVVKNPTMIRVILLIGRIQHQMHMHWGQRHGEWLTGHLFLFLHILVTHFHPVYAGWIRL